MKNKTINLIIKAIIIVMVILVCVFVAFMYLNTKKDEQDINDKIEEEIDYLDIKITSLINRINGIQLENYKVAITKIQEEETKTDSSEEKPSEEGKEASNQEDQEGSTSGQETEITKMEKKQTAEKVGETNWELLQGEVEVFYTVWASVLLDIYETGVESDKIVEFSTTIDQALISIKEKDKAQSCEKLAKLYSILPEFASKGNIEENKQNLISAKSNIINAYAKIETEKWEDVLEEVKNSESKIVQNINNINKKDDPKKMSINKTYILIGELKNSLSTKDKGIFYIKYKNLLEEMNALL